MKKDEGWMMKDDDFKLLRGFGDGRTDGQTFVIVESLSRLKTNGEEQAKYGGWNNFVYDNPILCVYKSFVLFWMLSIQACNMIP